MDQHLGASITLSFGLVFVFAIVLYQPEHAPLSRAGPEIAARKPEHPPPAPPAPLPALSPTEPLTVRPTQATFGSDAGEMRPIAAASRIERAAARPPPSSARVGARRSAAVLPPTAGFTRVLEGETLRDVALRLYGSSEEAESLWRLNRDLIRRKEGTLPAGTLLRTP
jgi:hypothetical protein